MYSGDGYSHFHIKVMLLRGQLKRFLNPSHSLQTHVNTNFIHCMVMHNVGVPIVLPHKGLPHQRAVG